MHVPAGIMQGSQCIAASSTAVVDKSPVVEKQLHNSWHDGKDEESVCTSPHESVHGGKICVHVYACVCACANVCVHTCVMIYIWPLPLPACPQLHASCSGVHPKLSFSLTFIPYRRCIIYTYYGTCTHTQMKKKQHQYCIHV